MKPTGRKHRSDSSSSMVSQKTLTLSASSKKKQKQVMTLKHKKVKRALQKFRELSSTLFHRLIAENPGDSRAKIKSRSNAATIMRDSRACENTERRVGVVEGIEIGDRFRYRNELDVIGLHRQHRRGIDYMRENNMLATSIVVTSCYANTFFNGSLLYIGEGGNPGGGTNALSRDQKLEGGNLAMKNSMDARSPVRVIFKVSRSSDNESEENGSSLAYVYDGLYLVNNCTKGRGKTGKLVFKFTLNRMSNQPPTCVSHGDLGWRGSFAARSSTHKRSNGSSSAQKEVIRRNDISEGKEQKPIPLMATRDCVEMPSPFEYKVDDVVYSERLSLIQQPNPKDLSMPFQLAIFKTERKGWGVRTRSYIRSGSFVCEFLGEVHDHNEKTGLRLGVDNYILDMGAGKGYIDATKHGNVARFINHSCTPNLCVSDEGDKRMFYAVKTIPAGRELTYNYEFYNRKLVKVDRIKCYCSSQECKGYIYNEG